MRASAGGCRSTGTSASPGDAPAKGCVERLQGYLETNFEPGRRFANELDFQLQLDAWFEKANARTHKTLRARPIDRLVEERAVMRALPGPRARRRPPLGDQGAARSAPALRHQRLLARPEPGRAPRRGPRQPARDHRGRAATRASSPAGTSAGSRSTARSPRSSTPARCASAAASPSAERRCRAAPAGASMTG